MLEMLRVLSGASFKRSDRPTTPLRWAGRLAVADRVHPLSLNGAMV